MRIAFIGKGGTGKSVVAGTIARLLASEGERVLALDFDTMPGLAYSVGIAEPDLATLPESLGVRRKKKGWTLNRPILARTLVRRHAAAGPDGIRFLQLGKLPGGVKPGSTVAFRHVAETFREDDWHLVGDLAAGTRQGFFGWAGFADLVAIVAEPASAALVSARRLRRLAESMPHARFGLVATKVPDPDAVEEMRRAVNLPVWAAIPYDREVLGAERQGRPLLDASPCGPAARAIRELLGVLRDASRAPSEER